MMTYQEYMEKYGKGFGHDNYFGGELMVKDLKNLLESLKDEGYECPDVVHGGVSVTILLDPEIEMEYIEDRLIDDEYAGEEYEMPQAGKDFLLKCFEEYNEKYATEGKLCDAVDVLVPDEMKYTLVDEE